MASIDDPVVSVCLIGERTRRGAPVKVRFAVASKIVSDNLFAGVVVGQVDLDILINEPFRVLFAGSKVLSAEIGWKDYVGDKEKTNDEVAEDCRAAVELSTERFKELIVIDDDNETCTLIPEALKKGAFTEKEVFVIREGDNCQLVDVLAPLLKVTLRGQSQLSQFVL